MPDEHDRQHYRYRRTVGAEPSILAATAARRAAIRPRTPATFVAVLGGRARGLAGFDRAWIVGMIAAAIAAFAGLATDRRLTPVPRGAILG